METTINNQEYQHYRNFWQNNLQKIEEISDLIERSLFRLEKKYADFQPLYDAITDRIDLLTTIYSHYNSLLGLEYLLKLKAIMNDYRKRYTHEGINFNLIYYIHAKIIELRKRSFEEFPKLKHRKEIPALKRSKRVSAESYPYKWITFERNNVYLVTPFDEIEILDLEEVDEIYTDERKQLRINVNGVISDVTDPLSTSFRDKERPNHFLFIQWHNRRKCFAASIIGKRILAKMDSLSAGIKPLQMSAGFKGTLRLFGINHIYIEI